MRNIKRQMLLHALDRLDAPAEPDTHISSVTLTVSQARLARLQESIRQFRLDLLADTASDDGSAASQRLRQTPRLQTISLKELDDATAAERISALKLDILVDLNGYNDDPRPGILARHPAAIQVAWLAEPYRL